MSNHARLTRARYAAMLAALATACGGSTVDLGHRDNAGFSDLEAAPSPAEDGAMTQTLYDGEKAVVRFTADETTLYAILGTPDTKSELVKCPLDRCGTERETLLRDAGSFAEPFPETPLLLVSGVLFWMYDDGVSTAGVASCPVDGCDAPALSESTDYRGSIAADAQYVYWVDSDGQLMRWGTDGSSAELLRNLNDAPLAEDGPAGAAARMAIAGDYVYYLLAHAPTVMRVRKDGSAAPEELFSGEQISSIAATLDGVYYTSKMLTGSVRGHALAPGAAERVVASNQRWPSALQVAGSEAFWVNSDRPTLRQPRGSLVSCSLVDCSMLQTRTTAMPAEDFALSAAGPKFAVNSRWLLWLERGDSWHSVLRRLPR